MLYIGVLSCLAFLSICKIYVAKSDFEMSTSRAIPITVYEDHLKDTISL